MASLERQLKKDSKFFKRAIASGTVILGILFGAAWCVQSNDLLSYKFFAPKYEQARRETFEESKAYNQGMIQEISAMQLDYIKANSEQKKVLASVILHRTADYDLNRMPPDLRDFINQLKKDQGAIK